MTLEEQYTPYANKDLAIPLGDATAEAMANIEQREVEVLIQQDRATK